MGKWGLAILLAAFRIVSGDLWGVWLLLPQGFRKDLEDCEDTIARLAQLVDSGLSDDVLTATATFMAPFHAALAS